jgi:ankyrin repeat protein
MLAAEEDQNTVPGDREALEILLNAGADPNAMDQSGWTALMYVARYGGPELARMLLEFGADPNAMNKAQQTALEIASEHSHHDVADVLDSVGK